MLASKLSLTMDFTRDEDDIIDLRCCPDDPKTTFDEKDYLIFHKPKFPLPIHLNPEFEDLTAKETVALMCTYHDQIQRNLTNEAKKSIYAAPIIEVPISEITKASQGSENSQEFYVSRSGRQTKRKTYTESALSLAEPKKQRISEEKDTPWLGKKTTKSVSRQQSQNNLSVVMEETDEKNTASTSTSLRKARVTPKSVPAGRTARLLEATTDTKKEEKRMETSYINLNNSIQIEDDDDDFEMEIDKIQERKVITPPNHFKRKPTGRKRILVSDLDKSEEGTSLDIRSLPRIPKKNQPILPKQTPLRKPVNKVEFEEISKVPEDFVPCPICCTAFPIEEIENHAATCGENIMETRSARSTQNRSRSYEEKNEGIQCGICELYVSADEYPVHSNNCIKQCEKENARLSQSRN